METAFKIKDHMSFHFSDPDLLRFINRVGFQDEDHPIVDSWEKLFSDDTQPAEVARAVLTGDVSWGDHFLCFDAEWSVIGCNNLRLWVDLDELSDHIVEHFHTLDPTAVTAWEAFCQLCKDAECAVPEEENENDA